MKKLPLYILLSLLTISYSGLTQPPPPLPPPDDTTGSRIAERMAFFIQRRMNLTETEGTAFRPIFLRYEKEFRETLRANVIDRLLLQQQIIQLQLRYRTEFGVAIGEARVIEIYDLQQLFIRILRQVQEERRRRPIHRRPPMSRQQPMP